MRGEKGGGLTKAALNPWKTLSFQGRLEAIVGPEGKGQGNRR